MAPRLTGGEKGGHCAAAISRTAAAPGRLSAAPRTAAVRGTCAASCAGPPAEPAKVRSSAAVHKFDGLIAKFGAGWCDSVGGHMYVHW